MATYQNAQIDKATAATHEIIAAQSGKRHVLNGLILTAAGTVTVTILSGTTTLFKLELAAGAPVNVMSDIQFLRLNEGEALNITLSGAVQVSGVVIYDTV